MEYDQLQMTAEVQQTSDSQKEELQIYKTYKEQLGLEAEE